MKRQIKISLYIIGVVLVLSGAYYKGLYTKYNFITAYYGILTKDYNIVYIGELGLYEREEWIVAPKLGFNICRAAGCAVNRGIINGTKDYNKIMCQYIEKNICPNWWQKLEKNAIELYRQDSIALSIVNSDELKRKRKDISQTTDINFSVDKRDSLLYQLSGYGYNESNRKTYKYFEITVDLGNREIKKIKNTSIELKE